MVYPRLTTQYILGSDSPFEIRSRCSGPCNRKKKSNLNENKCQRSLLKEISVVREFISKNRVDFMRELMFSGSFYEGSFFQKNRKY